MKSDKIKKIPEGAKAAIVYTLSSVFSRGLAIITVPIFTRIMSTEQIGIVNLYNSWVVMLNVFVTLSLTSGGFNSAMQEYKENRNEYQSSVLTLTTIMALILLISYLVLPKIWEKGTGLPRPLILLMLIGYFFTPAQEFWLLRQRYEYKYKLSALVTMGTAVVASTLSIFLVIQMNNTHSQNIATGRLFSTNLISYGVAAIFWIFLMRRGKLYVNIDYWKYSLTISIPLIGFAFANQVLNVSDRMMISRMVNNSAVGIYSTLYTVSSLSLMFWTAINSSFIPYLYQNIEIKESKVKSLSLELMAAYGAVALALTLFAPEIVKLLATSEYYEAIYIMPPIAGGVYLTSVSNMFSNILVYYKKTKYIMYSASIAAIINVLLNALFIPIFGYMAAAYTTLLSYIVMASFLVFWTNRFETKVLKKSWHTYNNKGILLLSILTIMSCGSCLLIYRFLLVRYLIIIVLFIVGCILGIKYIKSKKNY